MSTPNGSRRRQPERNAKTRTAKEQMGQRKLKHGMHSATPNSYYLAIAQRNAEESALLRLPPEIRQRIWTYVVQAQIVHIGSWDPMDSEDYPEQGMIRVCRQIHAETCLLPYAVHYFRLYEDLWLKEWIARRLPEQTAAVQRLEVWCDDCLTMPLVLLPGLCSLTVYCSCGECHDDDSVQGKIIEEALKHSCGNPDIKIKIS